jgi:SlyX protein
LADVNTTEAERLEDGRLELERLELERLGSRIDALEARLTFQDDTIEALNSTITEQWKQIDALTRQVALLGARLREAENNAPGAANEAPPHY